MQNSSQPKLISIPFADNGARQDIPNASQIGVTAGRASYFDGFPPLTRTPLVAGGVPPFGTDFNGVLNDITNAIRWAQSGAGYAFNSAFNTAINGYPKGSRIPNSALNGFWLNTVDGNTANPENTDASLTGWVPSGGYGITTITGLSGSSLTLSSLQASKERIVLSGTLTSNINLIVPAWIFRWTVVNNCTGNFTVTVKTPSGSGVAVPTGLAAYLYGDGTNIQQDTSILSVNVRAANLARYTSSGSFVVPAGITTIYITATGGGGGGGAGGGGDNTYYGGGGGGGGAGQSIIKQPYTVQPNSSIGITIGSAGTGGVGNASTGGNGSAGGATIIGSLVTLSGGSAGLNGGVGNTSAPGAAGGAGFPQGSAGNDGNNTVATGSGGAGANSFFGGAGGSGRAATTNGAAGSASYGFGSGGGGGGGHYSSGNGVSNGGNGGNGNSGIVIIEW